jgi:GcrA cell cycle regulator
MTENRWTSELVARLTELWESGAPMAQIKSRLNLNKNMIIGKVHRLGLSKRASTKQIWDPSLVSRFKELWEDGKTVYQIAETLGVSKQSVKNKRAKLYLSPQTAKPIFKTRDVPQKIVKVSLSIRPTNRSQDCQWPIGMPGEEGFHFCGNDTDGYRSYCDKHSDIAYVRAREK